jgi:hypothetical protein
MKMRKPLYMSVQSTADEWEEFCSWCGCPVRTDEQKRIHDQWHRAVGVVPLNVPSGSDEKGPVLQAPITVEDLQPGE